MGDRPDGQLGGRRQVQRVEGAGDGIAPGGGLLDGRGLAGGRLTKRALDGGETYPPGPPPDAGRGRIGVGSTDSPGALVARQGRTWRRLYRLPPSFEGKGGRGVRLTSNAARRARQSARDSGGTVPRTA